MIFLYSITDEGEGTTFDSSSSSTIKLNNGTVLYLREVNKFLALVCILREDNFDKQGKFFIVELIIFVITLFFLGLIDYNFNCFREAIQEVFELRNKMRVGHVNTQIVYNQKNSLGSNQSPNGYANHY